VVPVKITDDCMPLLLHPVQQQIVGKWLTIDGGNHQRQRFKLLLQTGHQSGRKLQPRKDTDSA
jgi:hypothetical protein